MLVMFAGFDSIRICLCDGRKLASQLNVGIDKGELMAVCSEAELTASQLRKLYMKGMVGDHGINHRVVSARRKNQPMIIILLSLYIQKAEAYLS